MSVPKFGKYKEECIEELGEEVLDLAKQYLKDAHMNFEQATVNFDRSKRQYEELLDSEITVEFLARKGIHVKGQHER